MIADLRAKVPRHVSDLRFLCINIICCIFLIQSISLANLQAQTDGIKFGRLSIESGLSQSNVQSILQDSRGFMWFGTEDGLNRYDGYHFKEYRHDLDDPQSLSHNFVRVIVEDSDGIIWVGTENGLNKFDRNTERFKRYRHDSTDVNSLSHDRVMTIFEDNLGIMWIGTLGGGLNKFDQELEAFSHYQHDPDDPTSLSHNEVFSIYEDGEGILWIATNGGLNVFNRETGQFSHYRHDPDNPYSISSNELWSICEDRWGFLWIGTYVSGLNRFDRKRGEFTRYQYDFFDPYSLRNNQVWTIYEDQRGVLWVGTLGGGLNLYDRENDRFVSYQFDPNNPHSLSHNEVASIYEDRSGLLWIGTFGGGLNIYNRRKKPFRLYRPQPDTPNSLSSSYVSSFYEDQSGIIWIGTFGGGLNAFERRSCTFTHYQNEPRNPYSLSNNWIGVMYVDKFDVLWIGTRGGGLNRFDRETETFSHYRFDPDNLDGLSSDYISSIRENSSGVWVGTWGGGLNRFNRDTGRFIRYQNDPDDPFSLSNDVIMTMYVDTSGALWIGTQWGGLNRFDQKTETFSRYQFDPDNPYSLSHQNVVSLYEDRSGILWVGTWGGGLNRFDREKGTCTHYREKDGLPSDVVLGILEDEKGNLWLSTRKGLSKFHSQTEIFKNYNVNDGLQDNEFYTGACFKSRSGEMFFGGRNGFNMFHPDSIKDNPYIPPIVITDFQIFNESVAPVEGSPLTKSITETDAIELSHRENLISFEFAALHYASPEQNQYAYILEGFDKDWINSGNRRYVNYSNLLPGEYTFRVRGSNSDGVWNEDGTRLRIIIHPPWWKTWWAYGLYMITGLALVFGLVRFEKRREREKAMMREAELRAQAAESEARAIRAENERKTHELEEARKLQLSMLPKEMPDLPNLEIAVHMSTANEVGGDYYDFHLAQDGTFTVAIGDATGHGMRAGNMVVSMKSLFNTLPDEISIPEFFNRCTKTLKNMHMERLYMCLALLRIRDNRMSISTAGMPPALVYRNEVLEIEEIGAGGIPLGWIEEFNYDHFETKIFPGDTILLMTDGYAELFNEREEMMDYPRIKKIFKDVADCSPKEIITKLVEAGERWRGSRSQEDDITFVVVKAKSW